MKKLAIIGLALSGESAAILAISDGFAVLVSDGKDNEIVRQRANNLTDRGALIELGGHTERVLDSDLIIVSPGVPLSIPIIQQARVQGIPVISEVEFAFRHEQGQVIAVTGSNGKSTTSTLIAKIFEEAGIPTFLAGNIGMPYSSIVTKTSPNSVTVLELSSFQLEAMDAFHPHVSVLLNLSPDHLDRYATSGEYYAAKFHIFDNQDASDYAVLWADQQEVASLSKKISAQSLFYSASLKISSGADVREDFICRNGERVIMSSQLGIPGPHNLANALSAVASTIPYELPARSIAETLRIFKGIEHRLECFLEHNGIIFVNDSKATNPDSLRYALLSFEKPIVIILGGYDKGNDFSELRELVGKKVKAAIFTGATGEGMAQQLGDAALFSVFVSKFEDAVQRAISLAQQGDVVMLSPGCASFDAFNNFEHRGKVFKELVRKFVGVSQ